MIAWSPDATALFHISEQSDIAIFHPRPAIAAWGLAQPVVWAVDAAHLPHYLLPRDCPRVCFRADGNTSARFNTFAR